MQGVETLAAVSILLLSYLFPAVNGVVKFSIIALNNLINIFNYTIWLFAGINIFDTLRQFV
jgi:hypothetical protein